MSDIETKLDCKLSKNKFIKRSNKESEIQQNRTNERKKKKNIYKNT